MLSVIGEELTTGRIAGASMGIFRPSISAPGSGTLHRTVGDIVDSCTVESASENDRASCRTTCDH